MSASTYELPLLVLVKNYNRYYPKIKKLITRVYRQSNMEMSDVLSVSSLSERLLLLRYSPKK